jgi:radical SAM superfamily enzyme YgiQ (UPF0313 family)
MDEPSHPYPAIPQLTGWLRKEGFAVDAVDLNLRFHLWLMDRERIGAACEDAWNMLEKLNAQSVLSPLESEMYCSLADSFAVLERTGFDPFRDDVRNASKTMGLGAVSMLTKSLAAFAFAKYFPGEYVMLFGAQLSYSWGVDCLSTNGLRGLMNAPGGAFGDFYADILSGLKLGDYDVIGISIPFYNSAMPALRLAKAVKKTAPSAHVTLGGHYVSMNLSKIKDVAFFDYFDSLVAGEGEIPLRELIKKSPEMRGLEDVPGLIWRDGDRIVSNARSGGVSLLDLPVTGHIFDPAGYPFIDISKTVRIRMTKSCSWGRCAFCNVVGSRLVSPERPDEEKIFEQVREHVESGRTDIVFNDEEATVDMLERFANRVLDAGLKFRWCINLRFNPDINLKWANLLMRSGCWLLVAGLESCNDRLLKLMMKGTDVALIERCLKEISWTNIRLNAYMMVGLPTETEAEARESFARAMRWVEDGDLNFLIYSLFTVSESSPIHLNPGKYGLKSLYSPPERDLVFSADEFEHDGMDRATRYALYYEITTALNYRAGGLDSFRRAPRGVSWRGRSLDYEAGKFHLLK